MRTIFQSSEDVFFVSLAQERKFKIVFMEKHSIELDDPTSFDHFAEDRIVFVGFDLDHDAALLEAYLLADFQFFQERCVDENLLVVLLRVFAVIDLDGLSRLDFDVDDILDSDVSASGFEQNGFAVVEFHDGIDVFFVVVIESAG